MSFDEVSLLGSVQCVINITESASLKRQEYDDEMEIEKETLPDVHFYSDCHIHHL